MRRGRDQAEQPPGPWSAPTATRERDTLPPTTVASHVPFVVSNLGLLAGKRAELERRP